MVPSFFQHRLEPSGSSWSSSGLGTAKAWGWVALHRKTIGTSWENHGKPIGKPMGKWRLTLICKLLEKTLVWDPPFDKWDKSRFRLGHGFNSKLWHCQRVWETNHCLFFFLHFLLPHILCCNVSSGMLAFVFDSPNEKIRHPQVFTINGRDSNHPPYGTFFC